MQMIRHRQRVISAVRRPGQALVPNRRATTQLGFVVSGAEDLGGGQYRLTGPSDEMSISLDSAAQAEWGPIGGRFRLYFDVINCFKGGVLYDTPKGDNYFDTRRSICSDPLQDGETQNLAGMIPSQNGKYYALQLTRGVPANSDLSKPLFKVRFCSNVPAGDYETYGNFKLERYL